MKYGEKKKRMNITSDGLKQSGVNLKMANILSFSHILMP